MRFLSLLFLPALLHAAVDARFGFVGTGGKAFSEKFKVPYYTLEGNYPSSGNIFSSVDPSGDPPAGHKVVREVSKLNVRNDSLGQTNAQFQTAFQAYIQTLATWYLAPIGSKPQFTWYTPNTAALAAAESLQIVTTIRREKTLTPAVTGTVWEIGNEPNLFPALLPSQYADLFSRYYHIIKTEDPTAKVAFGSIFLRETAEDLKPRMQELLQQILVANGLLTLLGHPKFDSLQVDAQNTLFSRIFNLGTVEYVNQCFTAMASNVHPDYITLHVYPYDDRAPTLTKANIKTKIDSLVTSIGALATGRGFTAPIWITEFGNINSALVEATIATNASDLIDIFEANSGIGNWFYYKATGADQQFSILPGMTPALTRLAVDSLFNPADSSFSCTQLNTIGQTYYLRAVGTSCTDATVPDSPTSVIAVAGNAQAVVFWTGPVSSGGSPITAYTATAVQDTTKFCATTGALTCTVTGLTNANSYTFTVTATNAVGKSIASSPSVAVTPKGPPNAPTGVTAVAGNGQVRVTWIAPAFNGGSAITGYKATAVQDTNKFCSVDSLTCTVTGLTNGTSYTFTVAAINAIGKGASSAPSQAVVPKTVPDAPTRLAGTPGNARVTLTWLAPASTGGSAITGYTVASVQDTSKHCATTTLTCAVTGLINGTPYTFTIVARNAVGSGLVSAPSDTVIPRTVPGAPTAVIRMTGNARVSIGWTAPSSDGGSPVTRYTATSVQDTSRHCTVLADSTGCIVTGLTNGTSYTFTVRATNAAGTGLASAASSAVIPATIPGAPTAVSAAPSGNGLVVVSWSPPDTNGGSAIIAYTVTSVQDNGKGCSTFGTLACSVSGLTGSGSYTFIVTASNIVGAGDPSTPSSSVTGIKIVPGHSIRLLSKGSSLIDILGRIFRNPSVDAPTP